MSVAGEEIVGVDITSQAVRVAQVTKDNKGKWILDKFSYRLLDQEKISENLIEHKDDMYKTLFQELRMNCLTKYGTQLYIPSYCNNPDSLQILMDSLYSMGIDIND